jgi:hypothetical protein
MKESVGREEMEDPLVMRRAASGTGRAEGLASSSQSGPSGLEAIHSLKRRAEGLPSAVVVVLGFPGEGLASCQPVGERAREKSGAWGPKETASASEPSGLRRMTV